MTDQQNPPNTRFTPYELLFRWNDTGELQGAHVQWLGALLNTDGSVLAAQPMPPEAIAVGEQKGFPLDRILGQTLVDALKRADALQSEVETLRLSIQNANELIASYQYELDQLRANIQEQQGTNDESSSDRTSEPAE